MADQRNALLPAATYISRLIPHFVTPKLPLAYSPYGGAISGKVATGCNCIRELEGWRLPQLAASEENRIIQIGRDQILKRQMLLVTVKIIDGDTGSGKLFRAGFLYRLTWAMSGI